MQDLMPWAQTAREVEVLEALAKGLTQRQAAASIGIKRGTLTDALERVKSRAARQGHSPQHDMTKTVPDGFHVKGVSTYYDHEGRPRGQWVKSSIDQERQAQLQRAAIEAMCAEITPIKPSIPPKQTLGHLCNVYTLTDSHVGMLAWHKEGGADWDLAIAEETLVGCFAAMIANSPRAATCVVAQLGDFLHYDGMAPVTPTNAHILDADSRFAKMVRVSIRILRRVIDMALQAHDNVVLLLAEGNHDIASSVWLRAMFAALYEKEPRIRVIDSELPYYVHQHGATMLAWHHGHLRKLDELPLTFAAQFPVVWGNTKKRYCHTGHRHHVEEKEHAGMTVIQHPTLAARDAYAARGGWISERQVTSITYSDKFGQVARNTVTPEMLA